MLNPGPFLHPPRKRSTAERIMGAMLTVCNWTAATCILGVAAAIFMEAIR